MTIRRIVALSDVSIGYGTPQIPALAEFLVQYYPGSEGILLEPDQKQRPPRHGDFPTLRTIRVDTVHPPRSRQWSREFCAAATEFLKHNPADIVLFTSAMNLPVLFTADLSKTFVIYYALEMVENQMIDGGEFYLEMNRQAMDRIDLVLFPEENRADVDLRRIGRMPKNSNIVLNCVNGITAAEEIRPAEGRNGRIFYGGELSEMTLAHYFFDPRIEGIGIDAYGLVEGSGAKAIRELLKDPSAVQYHGYVDASQLKRQRSSFAYSLITWAPLSDHTRFASPNKFFESIASGVPPICAPHPQCKDIINRYGCGILMADWSRDSLVEAISRARSIYGTPAYEDLVEACRAAVAAEINWPYQMSKLVSVLPPRPADSGAWTPDPVPQAVVARLQERLWKLRDAGRLEEAAQAARRALLVDPDAVAVLRLLADILDRQGRGSEAVALLKRVAAMGAEPVAADVALALHRLGRTTEARAWLDRARRGEADEDRTVVAAAVMDGRPAALEEAARIAPDDPDLLVARAAHAPPLDAMRLLAQALVVAPGRPAALAGIAELLLRRGDTAGAVTHLMHLPPGLATAAPLWQRVMERLVIQRRWGHAIVVAEAGLRRFPTLKALWLLLAQAQEALGDVVGVARSRAQVAELEPVPLPESEAGTLRGTPQQDAVACLLTDRPVPAAVPAAPASVREAPVERTAEPLRLPGHLAGCKPVLFPVIDRPAASVIVSYSGNLEGILSALRALAAAGDRVRHEVILIDAGATDDARFLPLLVKGSRTACCQPGAGIGEARNEGARMARAPVLVFLDATAVVAPGSLDALMETLERHPDAGMVGSRVLDDAGRILEAGGALFRDGSTAALGRGDQAGRPEYGYLREVDCCSGVLLAVRAEMFAAAGGFDPQYAPAGHEDVDMGLAVRARGARVLYQPAATATCPAAPETEAASYRTRNARRLARKWGDALAHQPLPGEAPVFRRAAGPVALLLIHAADSADSETDDTIARALVDAGFSVTVAGGHGRPLCPDDIGSRDDLRALQRDGVEVLYAPHFPSVEDALHRRGRGGRLIVAARPVDVASARAACPQAAVVQVITRVAADTVAAEADGVLAFGREAAEQVRWRAPEKPVECLETSLSDGAAVRRLMERVGGSGAAVAKPEHAQAANAC